MTVTNDEVQRGMTLRMTLPETVESILQEAGLQSYLDEVLAALSSGTGPTTRDGMYAYRIVLKSPRWRERTRFNPGSSHIPTVPFSSFAGSIVACAYNLNQCRPGKESKPGEACWSVRAAPEGIETVEEAVDYFSKKGSTGAPVTAYTEGVLLRDVGFSVHDPVLRRVQKQGAKDVFAFAVGRAVSTSSKTVKVPKVWHAVQFSPLLPPKGRGERVFHVQGEPVEHVDWFMGEGRKAVANVGRRNPDALVSATLRDLRELLEKTPELA